MLKDNKSESDLRLIVLNLQGKTFRVVTDFVQKSCGVTVYGSFGSAIGRDPVFQMIGEQIETQKVSVAFGK